MEMITLMEGQGETDSMADQEEIHALMGKGLRVVSKQF